MNKSEFESKVVLIASDTQTPQLYWREKILAQDEAGRGFVHVFDIDKEPVFRAGDYYIVHNEDERVLYKIKPEFKKPAAQLELPFKDL